jgi:phage terminase large subunit-like protein
MARDVVRTLEDNGVKMIEVSQNMMSLTASAKGFESLVLSGKLIHSGHPVLRWNLDCSTIYSDVNGNIKVQKPDLMKSTKRIDGVIASIIALSRIQKAPPVFKSIYSTRGALSVDICVQCDKMRKLKNNPNALCPMHALKAKTI